MIDEVVIQKRKSAIRSICAYSDIRFCILNSFMKMESPPSHEHLQRDRRPRHPWLAGLANLIAPPLGHIYTGKPLRGVALTLVTTLVGIGAVSLALWPTGVITVTLMALLLLIAYAVVIVDSIMVAKWFSREYRLKCYNRSYVYLLVFVFVVTLGGVIKSGVRAYLVQAYRLPANSMAPTLLIGDHILVDKVVYRSRSPARFEVVVFKFPEDPQKEMVKRVIGLPGEIIEIREKKVFVNGNELGERYAYFAEAEPDKPLPQDVYGPFQIPEHGYVLLGDNRNRSYDSRFFGPVDRDRIYGQVRLVYFSWDRENSSVRWDRIGKTVE